MDSHKLLVRQLAKATSPAGLLNVEVLIPLISTAYEEVDLDRRRADRANRLMSDELNALNGELTAVASAFALQNVRFKAALDNLQQGLCLFDQRGCIVVCNRRFMEIYEIDPSIDPMGLSLAELLGSSHALAREERRDALVADHVGMPTIVRSTREQHWSAGRVIAILRSPVDDGGYLDTIDDVTENRAALTRVAFMARHDALTSLPNRVLFREHLAQSITTAAPEKFCVVAIIDLDGFKTVNDTLGHPVGDALLVAVGERLSRVVGPSSLAARLGGDEFAVVLGQVETPAAASRWAEELIADLSRAYTLNGHGVIIGASVGLEFVAAPDHNPDDTIRNADLALYKAKADGRGCHRIFSPELYSSLRDRHQLEMDLRAAAANGELEVHYQPQVDTRDHRVIGFEALARWRHPRRGYVPPATFIPLAEETGLIASIGSWVLEQACKDALTWPSAITLSVNLSVVQLRSRDLAAAVADTLQRTGLDPQRLDLEVTESVVMQDAKSLQTLHDLKRVGVTVSLDDFGTGYSSLNLLCRFPFDKIKIDRSFVKDLTTRSESLPIIRAVTELGTTLGMMTIVEGVETEAELHMIQGEGVVYVQGYIFGRPMPLADTKYLLSANRPWVDWLRACVGAIVDAPAHKSSTGPGKTVNPLSRR